MREETLSINTDRLMDTLEASAKIGTLSRGGLGRLTLTDEDKEMRDLFISWLKEIGLEVRVDDFGNIYGRKEGKNKDAPAVLIGSHLDTQPEGGRFDGILGVLSGLEVMRILCENKIEHDRPIEIVNFTNEEGARFEPPLMGSAGITGMFDEAFIFSRQDVNGKIFKDEIQRIGYNGLKSNRAKEIHSFIELHIEQGPLLEEKGISVGAVEGIQGMNWFEVKLTGQRDHAGPTPMSMRNDALVVAAKMITEIQKKALETDDEATATVGRISVTEESINCVPGEVVFSLDVRHSSDVIRERLIASIREKISTIALIEGVSIEITDIWATSASHFSADIVDLIKDGASELGCSVHSMISGAGHDAKYMNEVAPTAMIFVPSVDGKSHCQEELTKREDIENGANLLLYVVNKLASEENVIKRG